MKEENILHGETRLYIYDVITSTFFSPRVSFINFDLTYENDRREKEIESKL